MKFFERILTAKFVGGLLLSVLLCVPTYMICNSGTDESGDAIGVRHENESNVPRDTSGVGQESGDTEEPKTNKKQKPQKRKQKKKIDIKGRPGR